MGNSEDLANSFFQTLVQHDWIGLRGLFHVDATWSPPGSNVMCGVAKGGDATTEHANFISIYGLAFKLKYFLLSCTNMTLGLHSTAKCDGVRLVENLATVCRLRDGRIAEVEMFSSHAPGMNQFFAMAP